MTAVLLPQAQPQPFNMQSESNDPASPRNQPRRQNKHKNNTSVQHNPEAFSDSNIPNASTPKPKKTPKQIGYGDRSASAGLSNQRHAQTVQHQKTRPASSNAANGSLATPSKPSYAGAAFHASPAPSSLPVPKFFSKSVPSANFQNSLQAQVEREGEQSESNEGTDGALAPPSARSAVKSPLDMFFNADRQEKARRQESSERIPSSSNSRSETPSRPKEMFMLELDDTSSPAGSQNQTPPSIRRQRTAPENIHTASPDEVRRAEQTQSLKSFLNITAKAELASPSGSPFTPNVSQQQQQPSRDATNGPHDPLHYGNRNLSPLFHAARSPPPHQSLNQNFHSAGPQQQNVNHYASVYSNQYAASPSKPPRGSIPEMGNGSHQYHSPAAHHQHHHPQPFQQQHQQHNAFSGPYQASPSHTHPQPNGSSQGGDADVRGMEERMKRMLKMG